MPQTLTKPVLLDETGQDISSKINGVSGKLDTNGAAIVSALDDIKEAIGTSSEFIPVMIKVVTPPTKISYKAGETLDLTGMVVNLVGANGVQIDVTSACTFSPANGATLTASDTAVTVTYLYQHESTTFTTSQAITIRELSSIAVTTPPINTDYSVGDALDLTGIVVTATYSDGYTEIVTDSCTYNPVDGTTLTSSDSSITITLTEGGVTKTTTQAISVKGLVSIAITTPPTQTEYTVGDTLDLTGIVVTATYDDSSTLDVTTHCTFSPANGATLAKTDTTITASYTKGQVTKTATQAIVVNPFIYGVEWDGTATTTWARTDAAADFTDPVTYYSQMSGTPSSPFDNILPWSGMEKITDSQAGTLVKIPKFWYKITQNASSHSLKIQIAADEVQGFSVSPAHMDRGDGQGERDNVYIGRYHCAVSTFKSTTGVKPVVNSTRSAFRTSIHNLASDIWQCDFAMIFTIWLLYLVEFADWNSGEQIGMGGTSNSAENMGYTDSMPYHTGTTKTSKSATGRSIQYRNIEGLWDNVYNWIDGCYYNASGLNIILNPSNFSDSSGGVNVGIPSDGFPKQFTLKDVVGAFPMFIATQSGASGSTYSTDRWGYSSSEPCLFRSAGYGNLEDYQMFFIGKNTASYSNANFGARLMKLPNS